MVVGCDLERNQRDSHLAGEKKRREESAEAVAQGSGEGRLGSKVSGASELRGSSGWRGVWCVCVFFFFCLAQEVDSGRLLASAGRHGVRRLPVQKK